MRNTRCMAIERTDGNEPGGSHRNRLFAVVPAEKIGRLGFSCFPETVTFERIRRCHPLKRLRVFSVRQ